MTGKQPEAAETPPVPDSAFRTPHSELVYVAGHRNPDTDSVCSAIAYAALRRTTDLPGATAARLGPLNGETARALERCGVPAPSLLLDVRRRGGGVVKTHLLPG